MTKGAQAAMTDEVAPLLSVDGLCVEFGDARAPARAVDCASFTIRGRETVALVGESGCGKSLTALALARLLPPAARIAGGRVTFGGRDMLALSPSALRRARGGEIAYVFQEPATSLNPVLTVGAQIREALRLHRPEADSDSEAANLLKTVGIPCAASRLRAWPHELSGGMQQRVMIAMALACRPRLLVADEPTTALDVTIQAQILALLVRLQAEFGMAILLITHNLGLVAKVAARVNVMYAGRIVEHGPTEAVLRNPAHPYTRGLLKAVPRLSGRGDLEGIPGSVPGLSSPPPGCRFHPRCPVSDARCKNESPGLARIDAERGVRCHYWKRGM